jgi:hypothetical protein
MTCRNPVRVCVIYEFQVLTNQLIHHFERQLKFKIQNLKFNIQYTTDNLRCSKKRE